MKVLTYVLIGLLSLNIAVMLYHSYKISSIVQDIKSLKGVVNTVGELYTIVGGSLKDRATLVKEKVDVSKIGNFLSGLKEKWTK